MRKKALSVLAFGVVFCSAALSSAPNVLGLGFSKGMVGGDSAYTFDLTSPYFQLWENAYLALRLSGDMMAKEGVLAGSDTDSIAWPGYFTARVGLVLATVPNGFMRLYSGGGVAAIFPTGTLASSVNPALGFYVVTGGEFFLDTEKHATVFFEIGTETTFGRPSADKMQNAPILGNGPLVTAGVRFYF